ncbi:DUF2189 domain-containing protein [Acidimangrovimonas pyrenivorans]|uniref:DUF2189 domain-containing protein n=1 Tax=Acidimangrovimonas pyrenivorans TaxID=2030798 RepID=A0ABV7AIC9_9RHOB
MSGTIGNPLSWSAERLFGAGAHLAQATEILGGDRDEARPRVRRIGSADVFGALRQGLADFAALRTDVVFLCLVYPVIGAALVWLALNRDLLPLVFPLMSGFALIGPVAAVGLYEMSRKREETGQAVWADAFGVLASPRFGAIFILGLALFGLFLVWMVVAGGLYAATLGPEPPVSAAAFLRDVTTTDPGQTMVFVGVLVGLGFAALVLMVSLVSFPLLLDRDVGLPVAVVTSIRVARKNPGPVALWGLIVVAGLAVGVVTALLGLAIVLPVLGHATWHFYRRAVG